MEKLVQDLRFAIRTLVTKPGFALVAVISLALGIGANTTIFSLINEVFLRPMPIEEPSSVLAISTTDDRIPGFSQLSHLNWVDIRDQNEVFEHTAGYDFAAMSVAYQSEPSFVLGQLVSGNYFETLGVKAAHGRTFFEHEDQTPETHPVTVLGHSFFSDNLGGDPKVVGQSIRVNGQPFTVIGVASPEFAGLNIGVEPSLYVPMMMNRTIRPDAALNWYDTRRGLFLFGFGRLKSGVTLEEARANLDLIGGRLAEAYPDDNQGRSFDVLPVADAALGPGGGGGVVAGTALLMGTVAIVLLIACANIANLLLARASERRKEIALRLALGVSRSRLLRQLLTESLLVALAGGALGILVAVIARRALLGVLPSLPFGANLSLGLELDPLVLLFTLVLSVGTGLVFGLLPALQSSRPELVIALKDQGEGGTAPGRRLNARNALVVAQISLSLIALVGSGLFLRSLTAARQIDLGFDPDHLFAVNVDVGMHGYDQPQGEQFYRDVVARIAALPGIDAATVAQGAPLQGTITRSVLLEERESDLERTFVQVNVVGPGYFQTTGVPIEEGRTFTEVDRADSVPVVVVNRTMADLFWPERSAIGQRFSFFGMEPVEVIGVARDIKYNTPGEDPQPYAYQPLAQQYSTAMTVIAQASGEPQPMLRAAEQEIRALAPGMPITNSSTVSDLLKNALFAPRFAAVFLAIFGALALLLAAIGIYGVMSYAVSRRTREIGIRIAMGASGVRVTRMVLSQGLSLASVGLGLGLLVALAASRLLSNLLFVSPSDPLSYLTTLGLLLLVALLATLIPAWRASAVEPIRVLRQE